MGEQAFQAQYNRPLLSSFGMLYPDKLDELFRRYGKQGYQYFLMLRALGFRLEAENEQYSHFEENYIHENFTEKTGAAQPAVGASIDITLSATDVTANDQYYPRVGDDLIFQTTTGRVVGNIYSIDDTTDPTAPVLTVYPKRSTDQFPAVAAGTTLYIFSSSFAEGTTQPESRFSGTEEFTNTLKIIKESVESTGTALNQKLWFDIPWTQGGETWGYYRKALVDLDYRMALQIGGACLFDVQTTNTSLLDSTTGYSINGTDGLFPTANTYGHQYPYTAGTLTVGDFDQWDRLLEQEFVTAKVVMMMEGVKLYQEVENMLVDYIKNTDVDYTRKVVTDELFNGLQKMEVTVSWKYFTKSDRTFAFKRMHDFSNIKTYGSPGSKVPQLGILIPMDYTKDAKTGAGLPSIGYRYSKLGDYSREFEMWDIRGAGGNTASYNTAIDKIVTYSRAHIGAHQVGANRFIVLEPVG